MGISSEIALISFCRVGRIDPDVGVGDLFADDLREDHLLIEGFADSAGDLADVVQQYPQVRDEIASLGIEIDLDVPGGARGGTRSLWRGDVGFSRSFGKDAELAADVRDQASVGMDSHNCANTPTSPTAARGESGTDR